MEYDMNNDKNSVTALKSDIAASKAAVYSEDIVLNIKGLGFSYDGKTQVIKELDLGIQRGRITVLMGANGCGKTTLLRLLARDLYPDAGTICLDGKDIWEFGRKEFARRVAAVHQNNLSPSDLVVERLVGYGRTPYLGMWQSAGGEADKRAIEAAIEATGIGDIRHRRISELSGGQRQRVWIAMALCQETDVLLLDEPTTYLDIRYQIEILRLIRRLNKEMKKTVVMVLHDINQALAYADSFVGMKDGRLAVCGCAGKELTEEELYELYDVRLPILSADGKKFIYAV